ncbi:MAG: hypothetical protein U0401_18255 [Anaerolineae bacterium]
MGAGRQGTAAAYDMALRGQAQSVIIGDYDLTVAQPQQGGQPAAGEHGGRRDR